MGQDRRALWILRNGSFALHHGSCRWTYPEDDLRSFVTGYVTSEQVALLEEDRYGKQYRKGRGGY
ncbi:MAG: hypothetical protein DRP71_15635 [Verrucomicrobia bacterium]|nr:MAG: hypothetical protein DRP71_15635 [Verrucomicrobiota bacterium]